MAEKFKEKYRIPTNRLLGYDYGSHGLYFITICTKDRIHYFGDIAETHDCASFENETHNVETHDYASQNNEIQNKTHNRASLRATDMGQIAFDFWKDIPKHYPFVILDDFVIMPNHIHGILFLNKPGETNWNPNKFGVQSRNLGAIVRAYKSSVKRYANQNEIEFDWQPRFHDRIIRDAKELYAIRNYIINNPEKWNNDELNEIGNKSWKRK